MEYFIDKKKSNTDRKLVIVHVSVSLVSLEWFFSVKYINKVWWMSRLDSK